MFRSLLIVAALAGATGSTAAWADDKADCMKGVAMIKSELKKKHPQPVRDQLKQALDNTQTEVAENDWGECLDYVGAARKALKK